jgi:hypothetical protein
MVPVTFQGQCCFQKRVFAQVAKDIEDSTADQIIERVVIAFGFAPKHEFPHVVRARNRAVL